jgi:hypothetical protein
MIVTGKRVAYLAVVMDLFVGITRRLGDLVLI